MIDGNPARMMVTLRNDGDTDVSLPIELRRPDGTLASEVGLTVELKAKETKSVPVAFDTTGLAWLQGATPALEARPWKLRITPTGQDPEERIQQVRVDPLPVVLAHGWNSDAGGWSSPTGGFDALLRSISPRLRGYAVGDGQFPGVMDTGHLTEPLHVTKTIAQNATEEAQYIEGVRRATGAMHVDIVAHSMGGLISRRYVQAQMPFSEDQYPVVRHLVQMGTPNMGSPCADLLMLTATDITSPSVVPMPSTFQLSTGFAGYFNQETTNLRGVKLSNLVGVGTPLPCGWPEDSDVVVPTWSARWTLLDADRPTMDILHTSMTGSAPVVADYVVPRLAARVTPLTAPVAPAVAPVAAPPATSGHEVAAFDTRVLKVRAGTGVLAVTVPAGERFGFAGLAAGVRFDLVDPSGNLAGSAEAGQGAMPFLGASADPRGGGTWTVRARSTATPAADLDVPITFWVAGRGQVPQVSTAQVDPKGRSKVVVTARAASQVTVALTGPTGAVTSRIGLFDDGKHSDGAAKDGTWGWSGQAQVDTTAVVVRTTSSTGSRMVSAPMELVNAPDPQPVPAPVVIKSPVSTSVAAGRVATFSAAATNATTLSWQKRSPGASTWSSLPDRGERLFVKATGTAMSGTAYRVVVTGPGGQVTSQPAMLTVTRARVWTFASYRVSSANTGQARVLVAAPGLLPSGAVSVRDDDRVIGTGSVTRGLGTVRLERLSAGWHRLRVEYAGSPDAFPSTSRWTPVYVDSAGTDAQWRSAAR